ncbi:MAG: hypothetical protein KJ710_07230 [Candidatus Omnitrophica bacterium]|nr:hypothetical protein [Candidatus Omnitrophota bacterium]MBU1924026.1 hypothetical protein [Candidatus Omnitrophota bacterium]
MKVLVAAIADHAWVENGCLSLCRTFDSINVDKFPYVIPRMSVALRLLINRLEVGEHKLSISLADADGHNLMNSDIKINFQLPQSLVPEASFSFALNGQNVVFQKPGDYMVNILVDGRVEASVPLYVREAKGGSQLDIPDRI